MSNHTILTIGAFIVLTTILQNFYRLLGNTGDDITDAQDMILATTIATSYLEMAQGLAFDEVTDTSSVALGNTAALTAPYAMGPDEADEDSVHKFDDFDDFHQFSTVRMATGTNRRFATSFSVSYVNPGDVSQASATRTFLKRIDLKTWRSYPPPEGSPLDTLRLSLVMGYFHFD
ncbi:MAG: hypothetical protein WBG01_01155 [Bacteroidota bacterium]